MLRQLSGVAVLDRRPNDNEACTLAEALLDAEYPGASSDPDLEVFWVIADTLPPLDMSGLRLFEYDQLEAARRDAGELGVYLVVQAERKDR